MRENRPYGLEGGESGSTGLPYPYRVAAAGSHLSPDGGGAIPVPNADFGTASAHQLRNRQLLVR